MNALQEEITQKTLALCVEASKMTAQLLQQAMKKVLADMEKHKKNPQLRQLCVHPKPPLSLSFFSDYTHYSTIP